MMKALTLALGMALTICIIGCPPAPADEDLVAGRALYDISCSLCHTLGAYDLLPGVGGDITGSQALINTEFVNEHTGQALSEDQTANLRAFVAQQS